MATRKIIDIEHNGEKVWPKGHAQAIYMSDGSTIEDSIKYKVDKVDGKQLSTEDFTTALKNKLSGLSNYDDTQINQTIQSLQTQINTLVSGNASNAIESFNEIIAFLNGIKDSQSLDSIVASIEQQISNKVEASSLAKVATSGSYNDLSNKPTIPAAQVNADWNATSGKAQILNKPTIPAAVTESTVSGWGFTKNAGTVTKVKVNGVEKSPSSGVVDIGSLVSSVKINGFTYTPTNGLVDLGNVSGGGNSGGVEWEELYPMHDGSDMERYIKIFTEIAPLRPNIVYACVQKPLYMINVNYIEESNTYGDVYTLIFKTESFGLNLNISIFDEYICKFPNGVPPEFQPDTVYELSITRLLIGGIQEFHIVATPFIE